MPIFDQGYQHYDGTLSGHAWRWLTVTRQGVRAGMSSRLVRSLILLAWAPALGLAAVLVLWGLFEQKSRFIMPLVQFLELPEAIKAGPAEYRLAIWRLAYYYFFQVELFFAILGKLGVIGVFVGAVAVLPPFIAYVLGVAFSLDWKIVGETYPILLASIAGGLIIVVSSGLVMLALSGLTRNSRYVMAMWLGFWMITGASALILEGFIRVEYEMRQNQARRAEREARRRNQPAPPREEIPHPGDWYRAISFTNNQLRLTMWLLNTEAAWDKISTLVPSRDGREMLADMRGSQFPWYWSAGILLGWCGLSTWILSRRVKSLDRLR